MITPEQLIQQNGPTAGSTLDQPLDHLSACHRRIEQRLQTLERAGEHLEQRTEAALEAVAACFRFFDSNGVLHTADEEESVFPRLRPSLTNADLEFIKRLEDQHREADRIYVELKEITAELQAGSPQPPRVELVARYRAAAGRLGELYRSHMAAEDQTLVALGKRVLSAPELLQISAEMKRRRGLPA
jgi:hemerythrin-like domain-containing protein